MHILVIEDSPRLRKSLVVGLTRLGHTVSGAMDGQEGLAMALSLDYDMILLDIMLPKLSGWSVLDQIRAVDNEVIIMLLTARDQVKDRVAGLNRGADDYLCKPFSFSELEARINALNRRVHVARSPIIEVGTVVLDLNQKEVAVAGVEIELTPKEYMILEQLLLSRGRVVSYDALLTLVMAEDCLSGHNAIEAHISAIRKKLRAHTPKTLVSTKRGFGYIVN